MDRLLPDEIKIGSKAIVGEGENVILREEENKKRKVEVKQLSNAITQGITELEWLAEEEKARKLQLPEEKAVKLQLTEEEKEARKKLEEMRRFRDVLLKDDDKIQTNDYDQLHSKFQTVSIRSSHSQVQRLSFNKKQNALSDLGLIPIKAPITDKESA